MDVGAPGRPGGPRPQGRHRRRQGRGLRRVRARRVDGGRPRAIASQERRDAVRRPNVDWPGAQHLAPRYRHQRRCREQWRPPWPSPEKRRSMRTHDFRPLPDLASRTLAGSVVYANDELFAERENLIKPEPAVFSTETFGHKGKIYDGWETRRRRESGFNHGIVVDTAWFKGNYPPFVSVEATSIEGFPTVEELHSATWVTLVEKSEVKGDSENPFDVSDRHRFTHVRLTIYPDGGVARLRVHGDPMPDPRLLTGTVDLAGLENGGSVIDCSNMFYSSPLNILRPDRAHNMGDGWENARRRDSGNDHVTVRLAARGSVRRIEIDTSYFIGNSAGWASVHGIDSSTADLDDSSAWVELIPKTRLQSDTRHFFGSATSTPVTHIRLDVFPDGGLARLRINGEIDPDTLAGLGQTYRDSLPDV